MPGYGGHMEWMWLWPLVGLVVLVVAIWLLARAAAGPVQPGTREQDGPETLLKQRYARGEIDRPEYEQRLKDLRT